MRSLSVHFLPSLTTPEELAGGTVVVIDVLRASTTIITALAAGAKEVIPCLEVEEAKGVAAKYPREAVLLGGERGGLKIDGFDLGNSPREYTPERVGGKTIVFSTTNGTRAMQMCRLAKRVLVGAFVNRKAITDVIADKDEQIHLLCAGTDCRISMEDILYAGALVDSYMNASKGGNVANDEVFIARRFWFPEQERTADFCDRSEEIDFALKFSRGGRNLHELGIDADIEIAAQHDKYSVVPELDLAAWRITAG